MQMIMHRCKLNTLLQQRPTQHHLLFHSSTGTSRTSLITAANSGCFLAPFATRISTPPISPPTNTTTPTTNAYDSSPSSPNSFDDYLQLSERERQKIVSRLKKSPATTATTTAVPTTTTAQNSPKAKALALDKKQPLELLTEEANTTNPEYNKSFYDYDDDDDTLRIRLNRYLARMGTCSRRQADQLIESGAVHVNHKPMTNIGYKVSSTDTIHINGQLISSDKMHEKFLEPKLYAFNKPRAMLCSRLDETSSGRMTIYDQLHRMGFGHLMTVGRLDYNSEGLLLLTNDGDLKRYLELPNSHLEREYLVRVHGRVTQEHLDQFRRGAFNVDGRNYGAIKAEIRSQPNEKTTWLRVHMYEGKNREIRKVFQHFNMPVSRLMRIRYGPYDLGDMQKSTIKTLKVKPEFLRHCSKQFAQVFEKREPQQPESGDEIDGDWIDGYGDDGAERKNQKKKHMKNSTKSNQNGSSNRSSYNGQWKEPEYNHHQKQRRVKKM